MIVTIAKVADFDQFLKTFSTKGAEKRREHGSKGSHVFRDPDDPNRVWAFFDWKIEDYERFLSDPEIPAIARELALREPPVKAAPSPSTTPDRLGAGHSGSRTPHIVIHTRQTRTVARRGAGVPDHGLRSAGMPTSQPCPVGSAHWASGSTS